MPTYDLAKHHLGKRYRTKKERLRMERGGPPYSADGSLDYAESGSACFFTLLLR